MNEAAKPMSKIKPMVPSSEPKTCAQQIFRTLFCMCQLTALHRAELEGNLLPRCSLADSCRGLSPIVAAWSHLFILYYLWWHWTFVASSHKIFCAVTKKSLNGIYYLSFLSACPSINWSVYVSIIYSSDSFAWHLQEVRFTLDRCSGAAVMEMEGLGSWLTTEDHSSCEVIGVTPNTDRFAMMLVDIVKHA